MNFRRAVGGQEDSFQLAPLVDILFLLLVFFIVTRALAAQEKETPVELPKTTAAVTRHRERWDVVVNVTKTGEIRINNQPWSPGNLRPVLKEVQKAAQEDGTPVSVIIRADSKALHEDVVRVLDACAAVNIRRVSFVSVNAPKRDTP